MKPIASQMSRRRFYASAGAFAPDHTFVTLDADETRHLREVLRLERGDEVFVFDGLGKEYRGVVDDGGRRAARIALEAEVSPARPESPLDLTIALALLKGEKFDLVVRKATELGVSRIMPVMTQFADIRIRESADAQRRLTRWKRIALETAKQSGRASVPKVNLPVPLTSVVASASTGAGRRVMFAERSGRSLTDAIAQPEQPSSVTALVGPEGGWSDEEIEAARRSGWDIVTLGGRILRAETAAVVAVTLLQHRFGDLS